jgi:hypothetical protein
MRIPRVGPAGLCAVCAFLLAACGSSGSTNTSTEALSDAQVKDARAALDLLQQTSIPRRVVAISYQSGVAPTTCSIVPDPSRSGVFKLYLAWASNVPGYTTTPKSVLEATINRDSAEKDSFGVHTFRTRFGKPVPISVQANASLARAALTRPNAQCTVLENGALRLVPTQP